MLETLAPFAKEGIGIFAVVVIAALFYYITKNMTTAFEKGTATFESALEKIMLNHREVLDKFATESAKGHEAKVNEIHTSNEFIRNSMVVCIKDNTVSNEAVVKVMEGVRAVMERANLVLDRVERKMDGHL